MTSILINMKNTKRIDKYLLNFFMQCNSLKDLLEILEIICTIQELKHLNKRIKHFEYLRFTFFGLIERAKSLLGYMQYKAEFLQGIYPEIEEICPKLEQLLKVLYEADELIQKREMKNAKDKIIEVSKEYAKIFEEINKLIEKYT
jgi:hypothetical protein